ncbi:MAG: hypothetical protein H2056_05325 [Sphingopyxis sp.]|nr:hypothetical protein [Sphingopyxis sp.]
MRMIIATVVGILLAFVIVYLVQQAGGALSPSVYNPATEEVEVPIFNTLVLFLGWFSGTFAGAWLAMRTTTSDGPGWIVAGAVAGAAIVQSIRTGDAVWVTAAGFIIPLTATWFAARAVRMAA